MRDSDKKFCKDCKYHRRSSDGRMKPRDDFCCTHESAKRDSGDLVKGIDIKNSSCVENRYHGKCGLDGQYYERGGIINFFKSLFKWKTK